LEDDDDSILVLQGSFFTRSLDRSTFTGTIRLEKTKIFSEARMVPQLKKMDLWNELSIPETGSNKKASLSATAEKNDKVLPPDSTALKANMTVAADKSVSKSEVANLPEQKTKIQSEVPPDSAAMKADMTVTTPKSVNKSDVANLPEQKKKIESVGSLPGGIAKPGIVARTVAEDIALRKTDVIRSIYIQSDSLVLSLYDNGEIDGDTVTIYHNNKLVVSHKRISQNPVTLNIMVNRDQPHHELVMVADNLGSIPPNTSLMIVTAGAKRYEVFISSTKQKNAKVVLDLKE